ncbi:hypothetical protein DVR12_05050 [Chitinophaga silvatica]|uniref:Exo-alpha-sialidase n=1 Tax=Chitinophaga silvatica TaxID=2282649 RepID=A0A3E1YDF2_9BACT|nr:hypothetical protein [Chitinophaga silvatica]RFS24575.1 hypothetical protein DVR12_05050 [Chitinophaga silvatica]
MKKLFFIVLIALGFFACRNTTVTDNKSLIVSHVNKDASCPYFTKTAQGLPVVSWIETDSAAETGMMYYAVFDSGSLNFNAPIAIPTSAGVVPHDENLPKILFKPDNVVIAVFGVETNDVRNKYAGKVLYTQSTDGGKTWQEAIPLVNDTAGYDQRYFDVALLHNGDGAVVWLDNRKTTSDEGSSLYYAQARGEEGFRNERRIATRICQCCRTRLYVTPQGDIHTVYRAILNDSIRDMVHQLSTDGGNVFSDPVRISADNWVVRGCPHTGPTLTSNSEGLHFAWFTMGNGQGAFYCRSTDQGKTYTKKQSLSDAPMAKHPQIASIQDNLLLVWDEPVAYKQSFNSRIGFQVRKPDGTIFNKGVLTDSTTYSSYPVIGSHGSTALVAYKQIKDGKGEIVVKTVKAD